jgi:hypothetical protein
LNIGVRVDTCWETRADDTDRLIDIKPFEKYFEFSCEEVTFDDLDDTLKRV